MKRETKKKASNGLNEKTLLAHKRNVDINLHNYILFSIPIATNFCIACLKRLGELLRFAKSLINFMRCLRNAEFRAKAYSQS